MKIRALALLFQVFAVSGWAQSDDRLYFYLECSQARQCIDLAYGNGKTESVQATPAQVLAKEDIKSASIQKHGRTSPMLNLELNEEASRKLAAITGENIGRRLLVVFGNRILIAPAIHESIMSSEIVVTDGNAAEGPFWENAPWLQDLIKDTYRKSGRSIMIYIVISIVVLIAAFVFVVYSRIKRNSASA